MTESDPPAQSVIIAIDGQWTGRPVIALACDGTPRHVYTTTLDVDGRCELKRPCTEEDHR